MSYDPYAGVSQQDIDPQRYRTAMDQLDPEPPVVLDDLWASNQILNSTAGILGNATTMMPGQVAQSAWYRGQNAASVVEEFEGADNLFSFEDQKDQWLAFIASQKDWRIQKAAWDQLPGQLRTSLQAAGIQAPVEPQDGGFEIPFTSAVKRIADILPGDQFGPGNIELFGGSDNVVTNSLDQLGDMVQAPLEKVGKPLASGAFAGLNWLEQNLVTRPLNTAQLAAAEAGWDGGGGGNAGMSQMLTGMGANLAFGLKSIFEGRVDELWQMTEDSRGTFKPHAMDESLTLLKDNLEMQALAVEFVRTGYDLTETAARISGEGPGQPKYEQTLMLLSRQMPADGAETDFSRALELLDTGRIGIGHQLSETWLGTDQGTGVHAVTSSLAELAILMIIDPTIVAGKANTVRKLAKYGVQSGSLMTNVHRARILARGAEAIDSGADVARAIPRLEDLVKATDGALDVRKATVMLANQGTLSRMADNRFVKLIVSEDAQLKYGRQVDNVMKRISWAANGVDDAGERYVWRDLYREVPATVRMSEHLTNAASLGELATKEKVWDYMESAAGYSTMLSGLSRSSKVVTLPMMNDAHRGWAATKNWWTKTIDLSATLPDEIKRGVEELSEQWQSGQITVGQFNERYRAFKAADPRRGFNQWAHEWGGGKQVLQRLTQHVTRDPLIVVQKGMTEGSKSRSSLKGIAEFGRYLEYGKTLLQMSDSTLDNYMQVFVNGNEAERMFAVRSFTAEMLMRSGAIDGSKEADEMMKGFGLMLDQNFLAKRNYDEILSSSSDAIARHSAIWGTQNAEFVTIPKFEELARAMRKKHAWDLFGQAIGQVDAGLSKWWKPMVLMRIGFIARAAGEETLSFGLKTGFTTYAAAQFGRRWSAGEILNPVTNEWESIEDLSPMFRRLVAFGQGLKKWTKTRDEDIMQIIQLRMMTPDGTPSRELLEARALTKALYSGLGGTEREETIGRLATLFQPDLAKAGIRFTPGSSASAALTGDERALVGQRLVDLFEPHRRAYLEQLPRTSRKVYELGDWAVTQGLEMSPRFYDMMRSAKVPSRKQVAKAFGYDESRSMGGPQFRTGPRRFSIRPANVQMNDWTNLSVNDYQAAQYYASHNPTIARIRANSMSGVWADIGSGSEEDLLRHVSRSHLSDERKFVEKTKRSGRKYYVPLSSPDRTTRFVDIAEQDAREAVGSMLAIRANDEVLRKSGAFHVMASFVDPDMAAELERALGPDWQGTIMAIRQQIVDLDVTDSVEREKLQFLRRALTASDSLAAPDGAGEFYQLVGKLDGLSDRVRWLAHPDQRVAAEPLRFDLDEAWGEIDRRTWKFMQRPDYQPTLQSTMRVSVTNGKRIASPLNKNYTRYLGVSMRADFADMLERLGTDSEQVKGLYQRVTQALLHRGYSAQEAEHVALSLDLVHRNQKWIPKVTGLFGHVEGPKYLPATPYLFTDPTLAQDVAMAMDDAVEPFLRELAEIDPRYLANDSGIFEVGMLDVPRKIAADRRNFERIDAAGSIVEAADEGYLVNFERLDPTSRVTFVEQSDGTWIDEMEWESLAPAERLELTGKVQWANGQSDWAARLELNHKRSEDLRLTMTNSKGGFLNEVVGPMAANTFEPVFHTFRIHADDLPAGAYAPLEVPIETTLFSRVAQGFFQGVADPAMEGIIRSTHFMHNFASNLPFADEYYHLAIRSKINDQVLAKFKDLGVSDDDLAELVDNIHLLFGKAVDDEDTSNMAALIEDLANPHIDPEDGLARLYAVLKTDEDKLGMAHDSMLEGMIESHRMEWGADPDPEMLAHYEEVAGLATDGKFHTETITERIDYLQGKLDEVNRLNLRRFDAVADTEKEIADLEERTMAELRKMWQISPLQTMRGWDPAQQRALTQAKGKLTRLEGQLTEVQQTRVKALRDEIGQQIRKIMTYESPTGRPYDVNEVRRLAAARKDLTRLEKEVADIHAAADARVPVEFKRQWNTAPELTEAEAARVAELQTQIGSKLTEVLSLEQFDPAADLAPSAKAQITKARNRMAALEDELAVVLERDIGGLQDKIGAQVREVISFEQFNAGPELNRVQKAAMTRAKNRLDALTAELNHRVENRQIIEGARISEDPQAVERALARNEELKAQIAAQQAKVAEWEAFLEPDPWSYPLQTPKQPVTFGHRARVSKGRKRLDEMEAELVELRTALPSREDLLEQRKALEAKIQALVDTQYQPRDAVTEVYEPRRKPQGWFDDPAEQAFFWQQLQTWAGMRYHRFQEGMEMAAVRATNMTVEFIDDHRFRSQFQQTVRNLMPFWFAEEQFIKRQLRMLAETPEAIRKASLLMNAGRDMGIIDQDADGNEIFVYPGSVYINRELARFAGLLSGVDGMQVYAQPMSTQVEYMLPGYSGKLIDPSFGPLMGFSTALLAEFFPELEPIDREGFLAPQEVGQGRKPWEHFYPQSISNVIDAIGLPFFDRGRLQAAENQAVQLAVAAGLDPGEGATPTQMEQFRNDIRRFARIQLVMNAGMYLGAPLPSGAKLRLGDIEIQEDMREILFNQGIPWQEAMAELLRRHPNAGPFTVFGTESTSGAPMDLNHESYQWMNEHEAFLTDFPVAGAWLMPVRDGIQTEDEVSKRAQFEALENELRARRTTEEFLNEVYISEAARQYYPRLDEMDRAIWLMDKQGQDTTPYEQQRDMFKRMFMNTHPVFADRETNQERRNDMKMERDRLLQMDPEERPAGPHVDVLLQLMQAHSQFNQTMTSIEGSSNDARAMREQVRTSFIMWAADYVAQNPGTEPYFRSHIRWDDQVTQAGPGLIFEIEAMLGREL